VIASRPGRFTPGEHPTVPTVQDAGWEKRKILRLLPVIEPLFSTLGRPARSLVAIPTELSQLVTKECLRDTGSCAGNV
jgi:hypothetical protein